MQLRERKQCLHRALHMPVLHGPESTGVRVGIILSVLVDEPGRQKVEAVVSRE